MVKICDLLSVKKDDGGSWMVCLAPRGTRRGRRCAPQRRPRQPPFPGKPVPGQTSCMGENNNNGLQSESARRRDGNIDFSRYTTDQLDELRDTLDPAANPLNHAALLAELEKRSSASPSLPRWTGRFSRRSGFVGWISARLRNSPLYGEGALELQDDRLVLQGWGRTWLGIGIERALAVPLKNIRNVKETPFGVRFEIRRKGWFSRKVVFSTADASAREKLVRTLPDARTARFEKYGSSLLTFEEQLRARCPVAWVPPAAGPVAPGGAGFLLPGSHRSRALPELGVDSARAWHFNANHAAGVSFPVKATVPN